MNNRYITLPLLLVTLFSCNKKETPRENLEFTREETDYTASHEDEKARHIQFTDITAEAGIAFTHYTGAFGEKWMPETVGSGGGFLDYDNDGWVDIFLANGTDWPGHPMTTDRPTPGLFRNRGDGTFEDVTQKAGLGFSIYGMGVSFADFDADGDLDIYMTAVGDNKLLQNNKGVFKDVTTAMKVTGNDPDHSHPAWSTGVAWVDVDRDGWLDLFVNNYVQWTSETDIYVTRDGKTKSYATPEVYEGESCRLYKNMGGKYFEDITEKAGVMNNDGKSLGVAIADFNDDLWPDIVVSNDTQPNFLYINNGDGTFANKAIVAGVGYDETGRARAGMGIDVADIDNNGNMAIAIGNFSQEPISLYKQLDDVVLFQDRAGAARLTRTSLQPLTFGVHFMDIDLDGYLDLITANGHIEPEINAVQQNITFKQKPQVFHNNQGRFTDISDQVGIPFSEAIVGRGISSADIDKDGDQDVLITANGGTPKLLRNDSDKTHKSIRIELKGQKPNLQAIGAKVMVWINGYCQLRMVRTGSSFLSQSDISALIVGIGSNAKADSVIVHWPVSGNTSKAENVAAGETLILKEE